MAPVPLTLEPDRVEQATKDIETEKIGRCTPSSGGQARATLNRTLDHSNDRSEWSGKIREKSNGCVHDSGMTEEPGSDLIGDDA